MIRTLASLAATCSASASSCRHARIGMNDGVAVLGDRGEDGGDQLGIGRQRQILLGAGLDRGDGGARIGADAAGDDRDG